MQRAAVRRLDDAVEPVVLADEARDERVGGRLVDALRRVELLDPAAMKHGDPIGHRQRLGLVVRHVDDRHAEALVQAADLELHLLAQLLVERAERLVHQDQLRLEHQRARQRDALLLAARELRPAAGRRTLRAAPSSSARSTRGRMSAADMPRTDSGKAMFSATVMCGKSA